MDQRSGHPARRVDPVIVGGRLVGTTARINIVEVEAAIVEPGKPWLRAVGVFKTRRRAERVVREVCGAKQP